MSAVAAPIICYIRWHAMSDATSATTTDRQAFGALAVRGYPMFLFTFFMTMMADNVEHVISYWVAFQKFHSAALGGFAVVAHWLPFLLFSVAVGGLNDRIDSRRLIQIGAAIFTFVSLAWGYLFVTDTLQIWHAMVLLTLHGVAGVFWSTSSSVLLYDIVGTQQLPSAVRLHVTVRYLGMLVGPGLGSLIMLALGPKLGLFLNACFYLPILLWLMRAPFGRHLHALAAAPKRAVRGLADILETMREVRGLPVTLAMIVLAGSASFFVGNSYQAQMPGFAQDVGHGDPGVAYTSLLGADAAGALLGGILLESRGAWLSTHAKNALKLALGWALALFCFALTRTYWIALPLLFLAGFFELSFSSMAQTLVQLEAPEAARGRVLGLFSMAASGLRTFSGLTVGIVGSLTTIHTSLAVSAAVFFCAMSVVSLRSRGAPASVP
jgi:MFS family permease